MATRRILIDGYPIDCARVETHNFNAEVTQSPVESGGILSDHIRNTPIEITIECIVSDTPIGDIAQDPTRTALAREELVDGSVEGIDVPLPSQDAYDRLKDIRKARLPVTIETSLDTFDNMALTQLTIPRNSDTTGGLTFEATFTQIELADSKRVTVRTAIPDRVGKVKKTKPTRPSKFVDRKVDVHDGTWFDPDINAWRESATRRPDGSYEFFKGRVIGAPPPVVRTDEEWREYLKTERSGNLNVNKQGQALNPQTGKPVTAADVQKTKQNLSQQGFDITPDTFVIPGGL